MPLPEGLRARTTPEDRGDYQKWVSYRNAGGRLSYNQWVEQARPGVPTEAGRIRFPWETITGEGFIAPWTTQVARPTPEGIRYAPARTLEQRQAEAALAVVGEEPAPVPEEEPPEFKIPVRFKTVTEGGWIYNVGYDEDGKVVSREPLGRTEAPPPMPTGLTPAQQRQYELQQQQLEQRQAEQLAEQQFQQQQFEAQQAQLEWERQQAGMVSPYQEQQFGLQQQRFGLEEQQLAQQQAQFQQQLAFQQAQAQQAAAEQEQQYRAQLQAQPINWLQYAAYTGEQPVVQPWMVPLGAQGAETQLQVGQPIPGVQGRESFAQLPQLRTPSAQLQARWGPTAQAQFLGYRQARTGARPEETQFRLGAGRAPTGRFGGFSRFR